MKIPVKHVEAETVCHGKTVLANNLLLLLWSGLYNITVEILRALTIKLTRARARTMARALARTRDRPRLRARVWLALGLGLWLALGLGLGLESVFTFKRPDRFCRRTKFNVTG